MQLQEPHHSHPSGSTLLWLVLLLQSHCKLCKANLGSWGRIKSTSQTLWTAFHTPRMVSAQQSRLHSSPWCAQAAIYSLANACGVVVVSTLTSSGAEVGSTACSCWMFSSTLQEHRVQMPALTLTLLLLLFLKILCLWQCCLPTGVDIVLHQDLGAANLVPHTYACVLTGGQVCRHHWLQLNS